LVLQELTSDKSPRLGAVFAMYEREFPLGERESRTAVRHWLHRKARNSLYPNDYHVLVATTRDNRRIVAFAFFHYLADINAGFLGYMAVRPEFRNRGIGSWLFGQVKQRLALDAAERGLDVPDGVFMELEVPTAMPAVDARLRFWRDLNTLPLQIGWRYPRLQRRSEPATMYLAFSPMRTTARRIPTQRVRKAVVSIYRSVYGKRKANADLRSVLRSIDGGGYVRPVKHQARSIRTGGR